MFEENFDAVSSTPRGIATARIDMNKISVEAKATLELAFSTHFTSFSEGFFRRAIEDEIEGAILGMLGIFGGTGALTVVFRAAVGGSDVGEFDSKATP